MAKRKTKPAKKAARIPSVPKLGDLGFVEGEVLRIGFSTRKNAYLWPHPDDALLDIIAPPRFASGSVRMELIDHTTGRSIA